MVKHIIIVHLDIQSFNVTLKGHKPQKHYSHGCQKRAKKLVRTKFMLCIGWRVKPASNPYILIKRKLNKIRISKCLMIDYGQFLYIAWDSKISCGNWFSICRLIHRLIYSLIEAPYTAISESATFWIRSPEWNFGIRYKSGIVWTLNADIFFLIRWRKKIEPSSLP